MKAIAEYFRDLAADDRYFGAEPPTPDAEMLARIAEREIARRVEAHEERGKIVLRAATAETMPQAPLVAPSPMPQTMPEASQTVPAPQPQPEARAEAEAAPEMIGTDETAQELASLPDAPGPQEKEPVASDTPEEPEGLEQEPRRQPDEESESIATKLNRIRSVVAQEAETADADYTEDEHAQDFLGTVAEDLSAALAEDDRNEYAQPEDTQPEDTQPEAAQEYDEEEDDVDLDAILAATSDAQDVTSDAVADDEDEEETETETAYADDFEDTLAALMADATPAPAPEAATGAAPMARVIKVKRAEFEAAVAEGIFDEDDEDEDDDLDGAEENFFGADSAVLSREEEADLQRELAEVEAELGLDEAAGPEVDSAATEPVPAPAPVAAIAAQPAQEPAARRLEEAAGSSDLTRIFDKTDTQLEAPASSQRRNAIQHLRAAVAATRAEQSAGSTLRENVDDAPYRNDLASVVRPRRPQIAAPADRSARPEESRPAPLKLVAEQRIDTPRAPIRPRRISAADLEVETASMPDTGNFSAFAEEVGANSLPDLLEAAAAYLSDIEGRPQFSRPMLMGKLKEVEQDRFSREDGLRSFGQLLRQGKLQKLAGGRFAVTEETEFRTTGRRHAG